MSSSAFGAEIVWSVPVERNPLSGGVRGRMMEQRRLAPTTSEWFLIASQGDMVVRIQPGMLLGETAAGEVAFFDPPCAHLELDIADDGSVVLSAVDDHELEFAGGTRSRRESLARHRRAEIRLPHNVLQLDTDFANPVEADATVEIRIVPLQQHAAQSARAARGRMAGRDAADRSPIRPGYQNRRAERNGVRRQPILNPLMAVSIALAAIGFVLLDPVLRNGRVSQPPAPADAVPASQIVPVQAPDRPIETLARVSEVKLRTIRVPPLPLRLLELPTSEASDAGAAQQMAERPSESLPEPEPTTAPRSEPIMRPPVERGSTRPVAERTGEATGTPEREVAREVIENQPDRAFAARREETDERSRVLTEALAQWQDLRAANLALKQGRLTSPPESNAYALFTRVLAQDPESSEARSGLQSVRQQLINRSLAQLAGGELEDARSSLQAAADAGADPKLIADLHAEVEYRQRLTDTENQ